MENNTGAPFVYFAHHKCASSWVNRFLWNASATLGLRFQSYNTDEQAGGNIAEAAKRERLDVVSIRNSRWEHVTSFPGCRGVHIIRDPRDVLVSGYFSHLKTHPVLSPELADERTRLNKLGKEEGLIEAMKGINGKTLREMGEWKYGEDPRILEMRLEDMSGSPKDALRAILVHASWMDEAEKETDDPWGERIFGYVNQLRKRTRGWSLVRCPLSRLSEGSFRRLCKWVSFERLSGGRKPGQTDESSHYRKGKAGDWQNHFTPEIAAEFKRNFTGLVSKLGYEEDEDW